MCVCGLLRWFFVRVWGKEGHNAHAHIHSIIEGAATAAWLRRVLPHAGRKKECGPLTLLPGEVLIVGKRDVDKKVYCWFKESYIMHVFKLCMCYILDTYEIVFNLYMHMCVCVFGKIRTRSYQKCSSEFKWYRRKKFQSHASDERPSTAYPRAKQAPLQIIYTKQAPLQINSPSTLAL